LRATEFQFNEAKLLGNAVRMDVSDLQLAGLISVKQDQVKILSAAERRRDAPLTNDEAQQSLFGFVHGVGRRVKRADALKIHPRDPAFRTHLDKAQALALAYADAGGGAAGIGAARGFALKAPDQIRRCYGAADGSACQSGAASSPPPQGRGRRQIRGVPRLARHAATAVRH
jgi:hypothetical protein